LRHKFAATTLRFSKNATGLLYNTGNFIVVGTPSKLEAHIISIIYLLEIGRVRERVFVRDNTGKNTNIQFQPLSRRIQKQPLHIANTVHKCYFEPKHIFLDEIYRNNQEITSYAPETFPGPRIHGKEATYLVFQGGSCLILGIPDTNRLMHAYEELREKIIESSETKESMDILSKYISERQDNIRNLDGKLYEEYVDDDIEMMDEKQVVHDNPKLSNYEKRLKEHFSFGIFVPIQKRIEHGIAKKVRDRIKPSDFSKLTESHLHYYSTT